MRATVVRALAALSLAACGGAPPSASKPPPQVVAAAPSASAAIVRVPPGSIRRSAVRRVLAEGPGAFLQRVELDEEPVLAKGRFYGFRIAKLKGEPSFWEGVDLAPGDVVTRVNSKPVERPQDAFEVFHALEIARELRVDYERAGARRSLVFPIVDDL